MATRSKKVIPAHEEFVFEVRRPSWSYHLSVERRPHRDDPFAEIQALEVIAVCLYPDRFKGREADVRLQGDRDMIGADPQRRPKAPNGVGSIVATKTKFEMWAILPADVCWQIGAGIASGMVRTMLANAPVFTPKHSFVNSLSFHGEAFDPVEYIG